MLRQTRFIFMLLIFAVMLGAQAAYAAPSGPDCSRTLTLGLHDHGLLYSARTGTGIDKEIADELIRRSGCKINMTLMPRARIWQLIESGALDFSLSGIANEERNRFASFAWYFSNKYYLLVRKDSKVRQLSDFEADSNLRLGVIRAFRYSTNANRLVDSLNDAQRVTYASSLDPLYKVLSSNRIQGMIIEPFDYSQVSNTSIREFTSIIETKDPAIPHGLIMSNKALPVEERRKWQALVTDMRTDGTMLRIFKKYFDADLATAMVNF
ncbi:hypothetical protein GCM10011396_31380 [Undibacterium terreum]|uniref:Solute-binding protein family 3/N-terminal domain-containing protein n=2 Tax=Undibacterium terreum TaxID=1224302 RepID=A0A916UPE5_9BURK|nr:hypothetical protein GCM10011396_31380 [Undibacterium terreum]